MQFYSYYRHNNSEIFLENADKKEGLAGGDALKIVAFENNMMVDADTLWKKDTCAQLCLNFFCLQP